MCVNHREIKNKYTGQKLYVPCRHCVSCQQLVAEQRAQRIRFHGMQDLDCLFFHLTYEDSYVPYIRYSELRDSLNTDFKVNVYRDGLIYFVKSKKTIPSYVKKEFKTTILSTFEISDNYKSFVNTDKLKSLNGSRDFDRVGVPYNKDIQNFYKRLRKNISSNARLQKDEFQFTYFSVSELGETDQRPHFHVLLFAKNAFKNIKIWKRLICSAWLFAARWLTKRNIEQARDAASYVSSYLVKSANLPFLFKEKSFRPRWSHSKNFAIDSKVFNIPFLADCIEKRSFEFVFSPVQGYSNSFSMSVPKYIICHYFPSFRGFNYLNDNELRELFDDFTNFEKFYCYAEKMRLFKKNTNILDKHLIVDSFNFFTKRVRYTLEKFKEYGSFGCPHYLFLRVRSILERMKFQEMYKFDPLKPQIENYDNLEIVLKNPRIAPTLALLKISRKLAESVYSYNIHSYCDPNKFRRNLEKTSLLEYRYFRRFAQKNISQNIIKLFQPNF